MTFVLEEGNLDDAESIAQIMLDVSNNDNRDSEFRAISAESKTEEELAQSSLESVRTAMQAEAQLHIVARQPQSRKIIGYAHWILPGEPDDSWKSEAKGTPLEDPNDRGSQLRQVFLSTVINMQKEHFKGKKYWVLVSLATHPDYRKRGVASALVNWGIVRAGRESLPTCLVVRPHNHKALSVYARLGFKEYQRVEIDTRDFGGKTVSPFIGMVLEPK